MNIRILIADDNETWRKELVRFLEGQPGIKIVAEAADGLTALQLTEKYRPDIILMDIAMPRMNGIEATRRVAADMPDSKIIGLSMHSDERLANEILDAGASGYVMKDYSFEELPAAIRAVSGGERYVSPQLGPPRPPLTRPQGKKQGEG